MQIFLAQSWEILATIEKRKNRNQRNWQVQDVNRTKGSNPNRLLRLPTTHCFAPNRTYANCTMQLLHYEKSTEMVIRIFEVKPLWQWVTRYRIWSCFFFIIDSWWIDFEKFCFCFMRIVIWWWLQKKFTYDLRDFSSGLIKVWW